MGIMVVSKDIRRGVIELVKSIEVKEWSSPDIENSDFENYSPESQVDIRFLLEMKIGELDSDEGEMYSINVVSPHAYKEHNIKPKDMYEKFVFVNNYNWDKIKSDIEGAVAECDAGNYEDSIENLIRFFNWEFEDQIIRG